jgi:hypothetical protein
MSFSRFSFRLGMGRVRRLCRGALTCAFGDGFVVVEVMPSPSEDECHRLPFSVEVHVTSVRILPSTLVNRNLADLKASVIVEQEALIMVVYGASSAAQLTSGSERGGECHRAIAS